MIVEWPSSAASRSSGSRLRASSAPLRRRASFCMRADCTGLYSAVQDRASPARGDFLAAAYWLRARPDSTGKLGAVGLCFGGGVVNQLADWMGSHLAAAVPFYGAQPSAADAAKIKASINAQYGELEKRITDEWSAFDMH
ncbi:MAG: dienelactone hydrolase family protein [Alphaproteobacteria bacterium]|nr:dienelactone hydrolase family protein [Alphaproteobacteria bacterium]